MATVDVLIPTFNRPKLLRKAVDSVLAQTFQDFRIIIWDDGSTTGDPDLPDDPRIEYHRSEKNYGVASARNSLFDLVKSPYACFLDDDDTCLPLRLEKQLHLIEKTDCDIVLCWIQWVKRGGRPVPNSDSRGRTFPENLRWTGSKIQWANVGGMNFATAFFKKSVTQYRFQQDPKTLGEATLWWCLLLKNGIRFAAVKEYCYRCLIHKGRHSWKKPSNDPAVQMEPSDPTG